MPRDHIIPKFILKGFAIHPNAAKDEQEVLIYDVKAKTTHEEKINDAYAIRDFNSPETEKYLCDEYENKIAMLFQRIKKRAKDNEKDVTFSNEEYKLLFRFFTIMWRRNNLHIETGRQLVKEIETNLTRILGDNYSKIKNKNFENISLQDYYNNNESEISKIYYDILIQQTTDNDSTVLKTIKNYLPTVVFNTSDIHFILHNSYGTMNYITQKEHEPNFNDFPMTIIEPISRNLCFLLILCKDEINLSKDEYKIKIENWHNNEEIKQFFIDGYITPQATSFVVDDTNLKYIRGKYNV